MEASLRLPSTPRRRLVGEPGVEAVAADGYRRYNRQTLEHGKKFPYRGPHAQQEERRARRIFTERDAPPRREGAWDREATLGRRNRLERREQPRRLPFSGRSRSRERGGERPEE